MEPDASQAVGGDIHTNFFSTIITTRSIKLFDTSASIEGGGGLLLPGNKAEETRPPTRCSPPGKRVGKDSAHKLLSCLDLDFSEWRWWKLIIY